MTDFRTAYRDLEDRMRALATADGDVFLPIPEPLSPVQYIFICMEPSLGGGTPEKARAEIEAGGRNFVNSIEDFLFHFSIRRYLCKPNERYHITDWSKGAMSVERAGIDRARRYDRWYSLLIEEIDLVSLPNARLFAVGKDIEWHLVRHGFQRHVTMVIHYSRLAGAARAASVVGHEHDYEQFRDSVSIEDILATAREVLESSVPTRIRDLTLARLERRQLTESQRQLIFSYKLAFEREEPRMR